MVGTKVNYYKERNLTHNTGWKLYSKGEKRGNYFNEFRKNFTFNPDPIYEIVDSVDGCFF